MSGHQLLQVDTACGALMGELQVIWDEVGEQGAARDRALLELRQECLEACRRKVDQANRCRAQLRQTIADAEAELAAIFSALGEPPVHVRQVLMDNKLGQQMFDGGYVHYGLLKAAQFILEKETDTGNFTGEMNLCGWLCRNSTLGNFVDCWSNMCRRSDP